jgi:CHAT domain-containing protein
MGEYTSFKSNRSSKIKGMNFFIIFILTMLVLGGCGSSVPTPKIEKISKNALFTINSYTNIIPYQDIKTSLSFPKENEENSYGIVLSYELAKANESYLNGDGEKALIYLDKAFIGTTDVLTLWQISYLKVQSFMLLGRDADAQKEIKLARRYETQYFGHDLNSLSLKGEILTMEGRYDEAKEIFNAILAAIGEWELPTSYAMPPSNLNELISLSTAQLRSYTSMAVLYVMQENYKEALVWAKEAEARFNAVHYISNHSIYGMFFHSYLDSYYGRAMNMAILATSILGTTKDIKKADPYYDKALKFFNAIGYQKGEIITLSLKAMALNYIKDYTLANKVALEAIEVANEKKMYDFIWRIETLRAKVLFEDNKFKESKKAFDNASNVIDLVSGNLRTDFSKRRFNVDKDELTRYLVKIDLYLNDYAQLFSDVERSRARAFVDMMRERTIYADKNNKYLKEIRSIDKELKTLMIENSYINAKNNIVKQDMLRQKREELVHKLALDNTQYAALVSTDTVSLKDIQIALKSDESLLYFVPSEKDEAIKALIITKNRVVFKRFDITQNELTDLMREYLDGIDALKETRALVNKSVKKSSLKELHSKLNIDDIKTQKLYVVGSGSTTYVPWGTYDKSIEASILPNASWILSSSNRSNYSKIIIMGNPYYAGELPQLEGALKEAEELASFYKVKPFLYKDATYSNLKNESMNGAKILHLATHGVFYGDEPLYSAIFLSEYGHLYTLNAKDIFNDPIKADLVVLSACETGMGVAQSGDDLLGLPRSFFLGGTKAIVSSLWPIDDDGAKEFMLEFHKYAKNGKYAKGLLKAKELLKEKGYDASVYGSFVLYGKGE